jgi:hypothetical protein
MADDIQTVIDDLGPLEIHISGLLGWLLPMSVGLGAFGAWPTWLTHGQAGLWAELTAGVIVAGVMVVNGLLVVTAARAGKYSAAMTFSGSSLIRLIICAALLGAGWWVFGLELIPLIVWMALFYLLGLATECIWIVRALGNRPGKHAEGEGTG